MQTRITTAKITNSKTSASAWRWRLLLVVLASVVLLSPPALRVTQAAPSPRHSQLLPADLCGQWRGFFQSFGGSDTGYIIDWVPAELLVSRQLLQLFGGTFVMDPCIFPVEGTVLGSQVNFLGLGRDGRVAAGLTLHGFGGGAAILDGRLAVNPSNGMPAEGSLIQLRRFIGNPDEAPPNLTGNWVGFGLSVVNGARRPLSAHFEAERGPTGVPTTGFSLSDGSMLPCIFPVGLGTINGAGVVVLIAQGVPGRLILIGQLTNPTGFDPCIKGGYIERLKDGSEDRGSFEIDFRAL